jgi:hypothetical protein
MHVYNAAVAAVPAMHSLCTSSNFTVFKILAERALMQASGCTAAVYIVQSKPLQQAAHAGAHKSVRHTAPLTGYTDMEHSCQLVKHAQAPTFKHTEAGESARRHDSTTAKGTTMNAYSSRAHITHTASHVTIGMSGQELDKLKA